MRHIPLLLSLPLIVGQAAPARPAAGADLAGVVAAIEARGRSLMNLRFDADYRLRTQQNRRKGEPLTERRERLSDVVLVFGDGPREAPTDLGVRLSTTGGSGEPIGYEATRSRGLTRELIRADQGPPLGQLKVEPAFRGASTRARRLASASRRRWSSWTRPGARRTAGRR